MTSRYVPTLLSVAVAFAADLPVTKVIIYKNGVAYFERAGEVKAGETARIEFKAAEMDDVLKSLVVEDRGGGKVKSVRYELSDPLSKRLDEFPVKPQQSQPLALLLDQMRGAPVEMKAGTRSWRGAIVSGRLAAATQQGQKSEVVLMLDSGELAVVDLDALSSVKILDPKLEQQFREALGVVAQARSQDKRSVSIEAEGARRLLARYLVPAPVWKSSYRLVLPDSGESLLEGWAIVDNSSGEDWNKVELAVVSGKPVSFITQLYEPKYLERPRAELTETAAVRPQTYESAMPPPPPPMAAPMRAMALGGMRKNMAARDANEAGAAAESVSLLTSSADVQIETKEEGELFEYKFSQPITARKGESAMIPFVQQPITSRRLLIYSPEGGTHPRSAAELTNDTGKTLDGGPLTVYQGGSYAGEALMETLKSGAKRLISYAVDLGVNVTTNFESGQEIQREIKASRGIVHTRTAIERTTTYTIANVDNREKTLVIEHPVAPSMTLLKPKADETTPNRLRFNVKVPAKGSAKLAVVQEQVLDRGFSITNYAPDSLFTLMQNRTLSAAGRKQLEAIAARKREQAEVEAEVRRGETEINEITRDQDRVRQNMNSLNRVAGQQELIQKYVQQLTTGDTRLAQLRDRQSELRKRQAALQVEIASLIEKLEF